MKAILINAKDQTITEIDTDGELRSMYELLGCRLIDVVYMHCNPAAPHVPGINRRREVMIVDDEGLLRNPTHGFEMNGSVTAGSALVLGCDEDGENIATSYSPEDFEGDVSFLTWGDEEGDAPAPRPFALYVSGW